MPRFRDIKPFVFGSCYKVNVDRNYLDQYLERMNERVIKDDISYDGLDMNPDFQRMHVWTPLQQQKYIEYVLQGGPSGRDIYFNNPTWKSDFSEPTVLVDGKQRLEAVRCFKNNEITVFGSFFREYEDKFPTFSCDFVFHVNTLKTKKEILQWYLAFNAGGTPHSQEEIDRVKKLLKNEESH